MLGLGTSVATDTIMCVDHGNVTFSSAKEMMCVCVMVWGSNCVCVCDDVMGVMGVCVCVCCMFWCDDIIDDHT